MDVKDKLMGVERAAEWFEERAENTPMPMTRKMFELAGEALREKANGVTVQEWVSVEERLPNTDEKCLLCMENRITKYRWVTIGYFHTNYDEYVTHWMPMPQPQKG
jgi:hypothetical protein